MSSNKLADELLSLAPADTEPAAIEALTSAYASYAADAVSNGVPVTSAGVEAGRAAMAGSLVGMSAPGAGLVSIPVATRAFWAGVALGLAASFPGATAITPPPMAALDAAFVALMAANTTAELSKEDATSALADLLHSQTIIGGTVAFPGPVVAPIL